MKLFLLWISFAVVSCGPGPQMSLPASSQHRGSTAAMVEFCKLNKGRKVGDGQCWALANEAMKAAKKSRPGSKTRVWGRVVNPAHEQIRPGDVLEFEHARFREKGMTVITGRHHTAVVMTPERGGIFTVAEQNFSGSKCVRFREMTLETQVAGKVLVYRPK